MLFSRLSCVLIFTLFRYKNCERRIVGGIRPATSKKYVVYFIQSKSLRDYDTWLCAGTFVHRWFVLTSAACLEDVQNVYVIAGYEKYVHERDLDVDQCTKNLRKRILFTCVPRAYDLKYDRVDKWSRLDIGIARIDAPYQEKHIPAFNKHCSYVPSMATINYDLKYEASNTDVIALGWGHTSHWREPGDKRDYIQEKLLYASTKIISKEECIKHFKDPDLSDVIDKYMICTSGAGHINDEGKKMENRKILEHIGNISLDTTNSVMQSQNISTIFSKNTTRRQGICQNDHGGPLVAWTDTGEEVVIGIASLFKLNDKSECVPPYMFTSTARNKDFIQCVLREGTRLARSSICSKPASEKGFEIVKRFVFSTNDSDGNEDDQHVRLRPQIPLHHYKERN